MAKNLEFGNAKSSFDDKKKTSENVKTASKAKGKDQSDYLKLDLRPKGGKDYKAYIVKVANEKSLKTGEQITSTKYLQDLIDYDMQRTSGKLSKREKVIDQLAKLSDKQLDGLFALLSEIQ